MGLVWSYGVTTIPERHTDLLRITLGSLAEAGFPQPRLFVDGAAAKEHATYLSSPYEVTFRRPRVGAMKNWILSLGELYYREPKADRYALFQDDFVTHKNLRLYLEACPFPDRGYWNLYTFPQNQMMAFDGEKIRRGWFPSNQRGRGAVALVFGYSAVEALLTSDYMMKKVLCSRRGHKNIDGAVINVMRTLSDPPFTEYVHSPTLVQHIGEESSIGNRPHPAALGFYGPGFDARNFLEAPG